MMYKDMEVTSSLVYRKIQNLVRTVNNYETRHCVFRQAVASAPVDGAEDLDEPHGKPQVHAKGHFDGIFGFSGVYGRRRYPAYRLERLRAAGQALCERIYGRKRGGRFDFN